MTKPRRGAGKYPPSEGKERHEKEVLVLSVVKVLGNALLLNSIWPPTSHYRFANSRDRAKGHIPRV